MKLAFALFGAAVMALVVQGGLAAIVPARYCPDFALLMLLAIGLHWEGFASGLLLSALLGFAADLLAGSLLGQHVLVFLFVFGAAQIASRRLNLRSPFSLMATGAVVTFLSGAALIALAGLFASGTSPQWYWRPDLLSRSLMTALLMPPAVAIVQRVTTRLVDEDAGPRAQRLARTGRVA